MFEHSHSLEGDLIATRNELAQANQHLHLATMELADIQRAALEADIGLSNGLSKLEQQQQATTWRSVTAGIRCTVVSIKVL